MGKSWHQLAERIAKMSPEERDEDATVYVESLDEYYSVDAIEVADEDNDMLDEGVLFLVLKEDEIDDDEEDSDLD